MKLRRTASIGSLLAVAIITGCTTSKVDTNPTVPISLRVPASQALVREVNATGVQIYECKASKDDAARFEWTFKAPEAELRDRAGNIFGRHYAGPTWEAHDGSKVVGEVTARDDGPDPNAIPWLLLSATFSSERGVLSHTKSIQRIGTSGGKAPTGSCNDALAGTEVRVPYKAEYVFYGSRP